MTRRGGLPRRSAAKAGRVSPHGGRKVFSRKMVMWNENIFSEIKNQPHK
jgi:hypothetical protein